MDRRQRSSPPASPAPAAPLRPQGVEPPVTPEAASAGAAPPPAAPRLLIVSGRAGEREATGGRLAPWPTVFADTSDAARRALVT
ncbi:MAG: hypothetical protein ACKVU4_12960, partial [Phycisphaerales bacterium]